MNSKQRRLNRRRLRREDLQFVCPECGEPGRHWIPTEINYGRLLLHSVSPVFPPGGFWICSKFYDKTGRRIGT